HAAEKQGRIVAARAPLGSPYARNILHVLDTLAVPLIVEGRKMMGRAVPLLVDVLVAALAGLRLHEVFRGYVVSVVGLHGAREELPARSVALAFQGCGRHPGIHDPVGVLPRDGSTRPRPCAHGREKESSGGQARYGSSRSPAQPTAPYEPGCRQEQDSR